MVIMRSGNTHVGCQLSLMVGGKNIFAGRANMKSLARTNTKLMLDKYKVRTHKSVTVTGTNLISKGFASCHGGVDSAASESVNSHRGGDC